MRSANLGARPGGFLRRGATTMRARVGSGLNRLGRQTRSAATGLRLRVGAARANLGAVRHAETRTIGRPTPRVTVRTIVRVRAQQRRAANAHAIAQGHFDRTANPRTPAAVARNAHYGAVAQRTLETLQPANELTYAVENAASPAQLRAANALEAHAGPAPRFIAQRPVVRPATSRTSGFHLRDVNPGGSSAPGRGQNCVRCAVATDALLRGQPAMATADTGPEARDSMWSALQSQHLITPFAPVAGRGAIEQQMHAAGSGALGIVHGIRDGRSGHVFNVVNQHGRVRFLDGQTGRDANFNSGYIRFEFARTR